MRMVSVTEIRKSAKAVLLDIQKTKKPVAILQRSKPVAYIVDPETFMRIQHQEETSQFVETRKKSLEKILQLKERTSQKKGAQENSVELIRDLREGNGRYE